LGNSSAGLILSFCSSARALAISSSLNPERQFYEDLEEYVATGLARFVVSRKSRPIESRPELEVDYVFDAKRPLFVFGVKDGAKARLATIACLEFEKQAIPFRSVAVHENFENLSATDRSLITNSVDKQFTDLADFKSRAVTYFEREIA
jgi:hypothetical protein